MVSGIYYTPLVAARCTFCYCTSKATSYESLTGLFLWKFYLAVQLSKAVLPIALDGKLCMAFEKAGTQHYLSKAIYTVDFYIFGPEGCFAVRQGLATSVVPFEFWARGSFDNMAVDIFGMDLFVEKNNEDKAKLC